MGNCCVPKSQSLPSLNTLEKNSFCSSSSIAQTSPVESLLQGITLLWLDARAGQCDEDDITSHLLQRKVSTIKYYQDVNSCLSFLSRVPYNEDTHFSKIFLIVSGKLSSQILDKLEAYPFVDCVFIFCMNRSKYTSLMKEHQPLVFDICTATEELCQSIDQRLDELHRSALVFHFFAQNQRTATSLNKDAPSYLWPQLFQLIISKLICTDEERDLMLKYCLKQLSITKKEKLKKMLPDIELFRQTYQSNDAIRWYTKETFVYHLLNAALRTGNFKALCIFRFYLADLCRQLQVEHKKLCQTLSECPIFEVYHGKHISLTELNHLREAKNDNISLNGFISTSLRREVSLEFARKSPSREEPMEGVLFIIKVNLQLQHIICAYLGELSKHPEEEEILFNIGTTYRIEKIEFNEDDELWNVFMEVTEDGIKGALNHMQLIRRELPNVSNSIIFGRLFFQVGDYPMAREYFLGLLNQKIPTNPNELYTQYYLALIDGYQGNLRDAEDRLDSICYYYKSSPDSYDLLCARAKNALGWIHYYNGELEEAISYYQEVLDFLARRFNVNARINAQTHSLLGDCYLERDELDQAQTSYEEARRIELLYLPANHHRLGVILNDLGNVFRKREEMDNALNYYEQAETIFLQNLPIHHPYTAYCWSCMAFVYLSQGDIEKAQDYHKRALKTYRRILPIGHPNTKTSEKNSKCTDVQKLNYNYIKICVQI